MKTISLETKSLTIEKLLEAAADGEPVFLTDNGHTHFALLQADDGDREVCALKSNAEFMAYLTEAEHRAQTTPRKSLQQIREMYGVAAGKDHPTS